MSLADQVILILRIAIKFVFLMAFFVIFIDILKIVIILSSSFIHLLYIRHYFRHLRLISKQEATISLCSKGER